MTPEQIPLGIRRAKMPDDVGFILNAWLKSQRDVPPFDQMTNERYFARMRPRVITALHIGTTHVAHNPEDADQIFGFLTRGDGNRLHYLYVKHPFRKLGVARRLFQHAFPEGGPVACSHLGRAFGPLRARYQLTFDPGPMGLEGEATGGIWP